MTQQTFMRAFPAVIQAGPTRPDGKRTLTGRLVPYDTVADVLDFNDGTPDLYREGFRRGAFDGQVVNGRTNKGVLSRIGLIHRHEGGLGYLGPFTSLREEPDGLWGDATVLPSKADDVGALLDAGVDELSIEFRLRAGDHTFVDEQGVRWRTKVHLDQVALEPKGAYRSAQVLAYRAEQDELERENAEAAESARAQQEREAAEAIEAENAAAEALERRRAWAELTARYDDEHAKQRELIERFGLNLPPEWGDSWHKVG